MIEAVYILCFVTSAAVAFLLLRAFSRTRTRILLWSGLGFIGLSLNNLVLSIDSTVMYEFDLSMYRQIPALVGMMILVFGLIWEGE
jgi:hypothetical protein